MSATHAALPGPAQVPWEPSCAPPCMGTRGASAPSFLQKEPKLNVSIGREEQGTKGIALNLLERQLAPGGWALTPESTGTELHGINRERKAARRHLPGNTLHLRQRQRFWVLPIFLLTLLSSARCKQSSFGYHTPDNTSPQRVLCA